MVKNITGAGDGVEVLLVHKNYAKVDEHSYCRVVAHLQENSMQTVVDLEKNIYPKPNNRVT